MATRTNLVKNPSFELGTAGWYVNNGSTLSRVTTSSTSGTYAAKVARTTSGARAAIWGTQAGVGSTADSISVTSGTQYTTSAKVRTTTGTYGVRLVFWWNDSAGNYHSTTIQPMVTANSTGWVTLTHTAGAPVSGSFGISVESESEVAGNDLLIDSVILEKTSSAGETYFDGDTAGASWTGTPHASTSTVTPARTNLVTNPSFELNSTGWTGVGGSWQRISTAYVGGVGIRQSQSSVIGQFQSTTKLAVIPGEVYTFSVWAFLPNTAPSGQCSTILSFYDSSNGLISHAKETHGLSYTTWTRLAGTAEVPANAASMSYAIESSYNIAFDAAMLEESSVAGTYFDGDTPDGTYTYAWSGSPHASTSTSTEPAPEPEPTITSQFTGEGTLTTSFVVPEIQILGDYSGEGTLSSSLAVPKKIAADYSGEGSLTSALSGYAYIEADYSGEGTLSSTFKVSTKTSADYSGEGFLETHIKLSPRFSEEYSGEGVLTTELRYTIHPVPLDELPLGKLVNYSVSNSAVPLNPAEGSGSVPGVNATFIRGKDPEFALGEPFTLSNDRIGDYDGEVVSVGVSAASDRVSISSDTLMTLLNKELKVLPLIMGENTLDSDWMPLRAMDYWTQACGLFYDRVPGEALMYSSGFGHTLSYLKGFESAQFFEVLDSWVIRPNVQTINGRQVWDHGVGVVGPTRLPKKQKDRLTISFPRHDRLVFSTGFGIRGTGREASVEWDFKDERGKVYSVSIEYTSAGAVKATLSARGNKSVVYTANVPAGAYRATFSFEKVSNNLINAKFTVHSDDLAGNGELVHETGQTVFEFALPRTVKFEDMTLTSGATGSGELLYRYGSYLSVAGKHPIDLPKVQKQLQRSAKSADFTAGFNANVWEMLNQFASIHHFDISFEDGVLLIGPRNKTITQGVNLSAFGVKAEIREKYQQVAIVNHRAKPSVTEDTVLWRSDSVYSVATREVFETTIQTDNSLLAVLNPVPVDGIWPFPYKKGIGEYVVTGSDGYIVSPAWWTDNGGKIETELTENEGEFLLRITAPDTHNETRSPYRISEGEADRPALYVCGSGIVNDDQELHINTGATNAKEGFDQVFDSPFVSNSGIAYDVGVYMAREYSTATADCTLNEPNDFDTASVFGLHPSGAMFTDNERNYKIVSATQNHSGMSANVIPHTTIAAYNGTYPAGSKIKDEKARFRKRRIKQFNIKPLKEY